jgi:hypothetical protein
MKGRGGRGPRWRGELLLSNCFTATQRISEKGSNGRFSNTPEWRLPQRQRKTEARELSAHPRNFCVSPAFRTVQRSVKPGNTQGGTDPHGAYPPHLAFRARRTHCRFANLRPPASRLPLR